MHSALGPGDPVQSAAPRPVGPAPRIAFVAPFGLQPKGTTSARALPIARALASQGARVRLIVPPWDDPLRVGLRYGDGGVEVLHTLLGPGWKPPVILAELARLLLEFRPDVVHCFKPIGYSGLVAQVLASTPRADTRIVVDADDLEGSAGWSSRKRGPRTGVVRGWQERAVARSVGHATVASAYLREQVIAWGVPAKKTRLLPNGFFPASFSAAAAPEGTPVSLLWYTRFTEADPARAARLFAPLLTSDGPRLTVLGDELNTGDQAALRAALGREGVSDRVDWLAYEPEALDRLVTAVGTNLIALYPLDDDLVNRARCPSKVPQLMARGIPMVAEAVGEAGAYLARSAGHSLAAPGDTVGFHERVQSLVRSRGLRNTLGRQLRADSAEWTWDRTTTGLLDWYFDG